jgi:hypothetical protein
MKMLSKERTSSLSANEAHIFLRVSCQSNPSVFARQRQPAPCIGISHLSPFPEQIKSNQHCQPLCQLNPLPDASLKTMTEQQPNPAEASPKSALQDNIEIKGKNSYYFAHKNTPTGPKWDGKAEPRLLSRHSSSGNEESNGDESSGMEASSDAIESMHISNHDAQTLLQSLKQNTSTFDFAKSNITKYSFLDDGAKIKIYVALKGVGDICSNDDDITLDWKERSFSLVVRNYSEDPDVDTDAESKEVKECEEKRLYFGRLHGPIKKAICKKKTDKLIVILTKLVQEGEDPEEWPTIGSKGPQKHELV